MEHQQIVENSSILQSQPWISPQRGSYFKYRGEGSQILWIRFGGGCRAGCRLRRRLICVWVRARKSRGGCWTPVSSEASSDVCLGEGSQIQWGAVGPGVVWGVVCYVYGWGLANPGGLSGRVSSEASSDVCVWVRVRRFRGWLSQVNIYLCKDGYVCLYNENSSSSVFIWVSCPDISWKEHVQFESVWTKFCGTSMNLSMLFGVYAGKNLGGIFHRSSPIQTSANSISCHP